MLSRQDRLIVAASGVQPDILAALAQRNSVVASAWSPASTAGQLAAEEVARVRVLVTLGSGKTSREVMAELPKLGLIACTGAGFDGVDLEAARERKICVTHSPGVTASSVADLAIALLIASVREIPNATAVLRTRGWIRPWPATRGLTGMRVGLYGLGAIGRKVATRLDALEVQIGYHTRSSRSHAPHRRFDSVLALAAWADALIVCVAANEQTKGSIDAKVLAALGPQGYLINVARSAIVDSDALCRALHEGSIAGAGLDVFEPADLARLLALPRALVTPHIAGVTHQAVESMCGLVSQNVDAYFKGDRLPNPVPGSLNSRAGLR